MFRYSQEEYDNIIKELPLPYSLEEQYLYSIVCATAKVGYEIPFQNPYWRKERYLKALWQIAEMKANEDVIPSDNTVSTPKIVDGAVTSIKVADGAISEVKIADEAVVASKIADKAIVIAKLAQEVESLLLGDNRVNLDMLATEVTNRLLPTDGITPSQISNALAMLLLGDNKVSTSMLQNNCVTMDKLSKEVQDKLNSIPMQHP